LINQSSLEEPVISFFPVHTVTLFITRICRFINRAKFIKLMKHGWENLYKLTKHCRWGGGNGIPKGIIYLVSFFLAFGFSSVNAQISLSQSQATSCFNTNVVFTATISSDPALGSVDLYDGAVKIASVSLNNGTAVFNINNLTTGSHTIKAVYLLAISNTLTESSTITHVVNPPIDPGTIDLTGGSYCSSGDPGTINSTLASSGGSGTLTYAWQSSTDCKTWSGFISGATGANFSPGGILQTTCYRRSVTDGCGNTAYTASVQFTIYPQLQSQTIVPNIASKTVCEGIPVSAYFSGGSTGIPGRTDYTDVYQYSIDGGATWNTYAPNSSITTTGLSGTTAIKIRTRREPQYTNLGCVAGQWNEMSWTVSPLPTLTSALTSARTNNSSFSYVPQSDVSGTQFSWSRDVVAGISNPAATGTGSINETLVNTTRTAIDVTYQFTLNADGCTNTQSVVLRIAGNPPVAYDVTGGGAYCAGGSGVNIGLSNSETGVNYQLVRDGTTNVGGVVAGTGAAISFGSQTVAGIYTVVATDAGGTTTMNSNATVTVNSAPAITTQPQSLTNGIGCSASFSVAATGTAPLTYQWRKGGVNIGGATNNTYTISSIVSGDAGSYDVVVTNACGSVTSNAVTLTVNPPLTAGTHNTDGVTACSNYNPAALTVSGTTGGSGTGTYSYQWQISTNGGSNWNDIPGATNNSYDPSNLVPAGTYSYRVAVADACLQSATTAAKTITIVADPTVTITGAGAICQNGSIPLGTNISGGTGLYDFRWETSPNGVDSWTTVFTDANKSTSNYAPSTSTAGTFYYRVILEPNIVSCNNSSAVVSITVNPLPNITGNLSVCQGSTTTLSGSGSPAATNPWTSSNISVATVSNTGVVTGVAPGTVTITYANSNGCQQTALVTVTALPATFSVTGSGSYCTGGSGLPVGLSGSQSGVSYQLQKDGVNVGSAVAGTGSAISFGNQTAAGSYTVVATNTTTSCTAAMSGSATISINPLPTAGAGSNSPVCASSTLNLTSSGGVSYSWTGPNGFSSTQQNPSRNAVTAADGGSYSVTVTDANGCKAMATTDVTITPTVIPSVVISATPGNNICKGTAVTFTADPTNGGTAPSYQWQVNGVNVGTNSATFTSSTLNNTDKVTVIMTSSATCPLPATATSNQIGMTVNDLVVPSVGISSTATSICPGTSITFTASPINGGSAPTYQWQVNGVNAGTNSATFTTSALNNGDAITVTMTSNAACASPASVTSAPITITVNPAPQPAVSVSASATTICAGTSVAFTATPANGGTTPIYQWKVNGTNAGTNTSTFTTSGLNNNDVVTVVMTSNAACASPATATSTPITITVNPTVVPSVSITPSATTICPSTAVTFTANPTNGGAAPSYQWQVNGVSVGANSATFSSSSLNNGDVVKVILTSNATCVSPATANASLTMTVNPGTPSTPGVITGAAEQCVNKTGLTYSISPVANATGYTWTVPAGWSITSGQGTTSVTVSTSGTAVSGNVTVTASNSCGTSSAQTFAVNVNTAVPATPSMPSGPQSICPVATGLVYTVPAVPNATSYIWNLPAGWTITAGAGTNSVTVNVGSNSATGSQSVSVKASNVCGSSASSANLSVQIDSKFATANAGPDQTICSNTTSININGVPGGSANPSKGSWATSGSGTFGNANSTTTTYTPSAADKTAGSVTLTFTTDAPKGSCGGAASDQMLLIIKPVPTASISATSPICSGASSTVTFTGTPNTTVAYTVNGTPQNITIGSSGTATLTSTLTTTTTYSLISVDYSPALCSQTLTGSATITVNQKPTVNAGAYGAVCEGSAAITLNGTPGGGTFSGTGVSGNTFTPTTAGTFTITYSYTDPSTNCSNSATTTITVNPKPNLVITNPAAVCSPSTVNLTASAVTAGSNLQSGTLSYWTDANATSALNSPNAVTTSGTYYIKVTTASNCTDIKPVVVTVNQAATVSAGGNQTICSNSTATMAGSFGGGASSGVWSTSGSGSFSNNTSTAVYTPSGADINAGSVTLTYTTDDPAGPCNAVNASMTLTIKKAVIITSQPSNTSVCAGFPIDMTVVATGDGLTYQWYKGAAPSGVAVSNSSNSTGAQSPTLHFNQAGAPDDGIYYVIVSGASPCDAVTSASRTLNVDQAISITTQPVSQTQCIGANATFTIAADANGETLTYQWRKNGVAINGQTSSALTLTNIATTDAGSYDVVVNGPSGYTCTSTISSAATLTVNQNSTIALSSAAGTDGQTKCINAVLTPITYAIGGGGTGASITAGALPAGVTGSYSNGVFTISGTPTAPGTFNYTVTTAGPCTNVSATGTITVNDNSTLALTSNNATQPVCANGSINAITYAVGGGATGVNVTGLPGGVTGTLNNGVFTISGNPTVPGTYSFTVTTTGPCVNPSLNGTITVNPNSTLTLSSPSADQRLCVNSVPTNITYVVGGGATGATVTGLPPGMSGVYNNGVFTISNTPTSAGTYNYTVTTTGNCNNKSLSGTILVDPAPFGGTLSPAISTVCGTPNSGTITLTGQSGTIIRWESSTNGGGSWTPISNTAATLNYTNISQTTLYRAVIQSGVCPLAYSLNAVVSVIPATQPTATVSPTEICVGQTANLGATSGLPTTWQDIDASFNQANPAGWRITQNGTEINFPANADNASTFPWSETNGPKTPFNGGVTYNNLQTDGKFAIASGIVNTTMETPVFSTIGMTAAVLKFYQALVFAAGASGKIEISTDGGATYNQTLVQYNGPMTIGNPASSWDPLNIDLSNYIGLSNLRIRFTYTGASNSNWAIDGLNLQPPGPTLTYNWTLTNPSGVPSPYYLNATNQQNVTATPPAPGTYTYQVATTIGGCPGGTTSVVVTVRALPVIIPVNSCVGGGNVTFTQTGGVTGGTWSVSGGGSINANSGVFTPSTVGCFTVTYKTPGPGCTDTKSFVVFPAAPVLTAPSNTCNTAFTIPAVTAVSGFSIEYSINNGAWSASPTLPTTPGCYAIQARYVLATACGTNAVGTASPGCVSNIVNVVIFPTAPTPVVNSGCGPIVVTPPASVSGFDVQYSFDDGATWGANTPPTADNCTGYKIKVRYVTSAVCGTIAAGTVAPAGCESPSVTRKVDNTKPTVTCPTVQPVCVVPSNSYTIPPLTASDNCSANSALTITYTITGATTRSGTGVDASGIFNVGVSTITWTVVDECGNSNTCSTQVTINPKPTPIIYHN
jgi:hypothetical protein